MSLRTVFKPATAVFAGVFGGLGNAADARMVKYNNTPFKAHLERAEVTGEDLATTTFGKYVVHQAVLFPTRFATLAKEIFQIPGAFQVWQWNFGDFMLAFQFFIRLMAFFLVGKMIGRESVVAPVPTNSIFWTEDEKVNTCTSRAESIKAATEWATPMTCFIKSLSF